MSAPFHTFNQRRDVVLAALRQLHGHCERVGSLTLARRIDAELVNKLEQDQFHLVVVGEFNHGKTTFVNALLGGSLLPVGVTPTTALIHHVRHAEERSARLVTEDGERAVSFDDLDSFTAGQMSGAGDPVFGGSLTGPDPVSGGSLTGPDPVSGGSLTGPDRVKYLEVCLPSELLRDRITLVDTPGVNDLCLQRADITYKYIPQADAVLFVIDAGQPLKESERVFLKEKLIGQSRDKIIFVVAKADIWSAEERVEALGYIRAELDKLCQAPVLFPISAERALAGDRPASGLDKLVGHLRAFLAQERGRLLLHNALSDGLLAINSIAHGLDARQRIARMSHDEIDRRIARIELDLEGQKRSVEQRRAAIRESVAAVRAVVKRDVDRFADDVLRQLGELIDKAPIDDVRQHLGGFLEATFVGWAEAESDEVARALEEMAERTVTLMREDAHEAAKRLSAGIGSEVTAPDVSIDTFGYDLGVAALFSVGIGMVFTNLLLGAALTVAAPALAYVLRGRIESETRHKALEQGTLAIRTASSNVAPKLDAMIVQFAERLEEWVEMVGGEVHRDLLDILKSAKKDKGSMGADAVKIQSDCDAMAVDLDRLRTEIERLRTELWSPTGAEAVAT